MEIGLIYYHLVTPCAEGRKIHRVGSTSLPKLVKKEAQIYTAAYGDSTERAIRSRQARVALELASGADPDAVRNALEIGEVLGRVRLANRKLPKESQFKVVARRTCISDMHIISG